jgi:hypothetical protein
MTCRLPGVRIETLDAFGANRVAEIYLQLLERPVGR